MTCGILSRYKNEKGASMEFRRPRREFLAGMGALAATAAVPRALLSARERLYPPTDLSYFDTPIPPAPFELHIGYASITWGKRSPGDRGHFLLKISGHPDPRQRRPGIRH